MASAAAPSTPGPASNPSTTAPASPAAPTPLAQREWRKVAQRTVRVAVTTIKEARARFEASAEAGHSALAALSDALLALVYLPGMKLGALAQLDGLGGAAPSHPSLAPPSLKDLAGAKLVRQQQALLGELREVCLALHAAAQDAEAAVASVRAIEQREQWQARSPVFTCTTAPQCAYMLGQVAGMLSAEAAAKGCVLGAMAQAVQAAASYQQQGAGGAASDDGTEGPVARCLLATLGQGSSLRAPAGGSGGSNAAGAGGGAAPLQAALTAQLAVWLAGPYMDEGAADEVLGALSEDMVGW